MTEREALKLALEALVKKMSCDDDCKCSGQQAITAIKEALAQQALDRKAENARELGLDYEPENTLHWHALNYRTAPTQNAQAMFEALEKFVASQRKEPRQEPVAVVVSTSRTDDGFRAVVETGDELLDLDTLLYATSPQRKPLSDEEMCPWFQENTALTNEAAMRIVRAIEAAHGIKGEA